MLRHASWLSLALVLAACTAGEDGEVDTDMTPPSIMDPDTPPSTPPETPPGSDSNGAPVITTESISGQEGVALETTLRATEEDGDAITFALVEGPEWLHVSTSGAVTGTPGALDIGDSSITVSASDGEATTEAELDLEIAYDPIEQALRTGDYTIITNETELTLFEAMQQDTARTRERNNADIAEIFELGSDGQPTSDSLTNVTWEYGTNAIFFNPSYSGSTPLLLANTASNGQALESPPIVAAIGRHENARFAVLGDNPFRLAALDATTVSEDMHRLMENMIAWLIDADPHDGLNVVIANLPESGAYRDQSATQNWLSDRFGDAVSYNSIASCESTNFESCITEDTDLVFVSRAARTVNDPQLLRDGAERAMREGIPVVYVHALGNTNPITSNLMSLFGLGQNTRNNAGHMTSEFSPVGILADWESPEVSVLESLIEQIERNDLSYDLSPCRQYWRCPENTDFAENVTSHLSDLQDQLDALNSQPSGAFPVSTGRRWLGFSVLLGDYYRSLTNYPMSKSNTPSRDIVRAFFGDLTALIARDLNPAANLGTFGRSEFPEYLRTDKTVEMVTQRPFRTTGVYAFPGETVTVTRTDESDVTVELKVHSVRENASAPFRDDYDRPLILSSRRMPIEPGQTLTLTSAFGGPIHAFFNADGEEISLDFENVGEHPVWRGPDDTSAFLNGLDANEYDWAEFVTPRFEIHSTRSKMLDTLDLFHIRTPGELLEMTNIYMRDWPHWLAGFEGPGISENPDLRAFANANGLTISTTTNVKHMNADRPACTSSAPNCAGTSGNPYDALWSFDPLRLGDLHELGHGLEFRARHHFQGGDSTHSTTNLYSFHTSYRY
ncbi:MAG: ImpA family metalloprotease, partial [Pseudomonadota bacterium]